MRPRPAAALQAQQLHHTGRSVACWETRGWNDVTPPGVTSDPCWGPGTTLASHWFIWNVSVLLLAGPGSSGGGVKLQTRSSRPEEVLAWLPQQGGVVEHLKDVLTAALVCVPECSGGGHSGGLSP